MNIEMDESKRWADIDKVLLRTSPLAPVDFVPGQELKEAFMSYSRVLVVGAGGLGCEILKDLALMGFKSIDVIDLDTIDVTNLNRQFLFRATDVGKFKSEVAAQFIMKRVPGCTVTAHIGKIQDKSKEFYQQFQIIIAGLDNIDARRWLNYLVHSLVEFEDNQPKPETVRALIDGGTEGFRGQARVIWPYQTDCFECTLDTLPQQTKYNFCTIAHTPRIAEHCIAYAYLIEWERFFGEKKIDTDSTEDMKWIFEKAQEKAAANKITGVTFQLTQGVVKNIIPAIASTNAIIAAACSNEAFKLMTGCSKRIENYMMFMGGEGIYTNTFAYDPKENCLVCSALKPRKLTWNKSDTVRQFIDYLKTDKDYLLVKPSISNTKGDMLYLNNPQFASLYEDNLDLTFPQLIEKGELKEQPEINVTDEKIPSQIKFMITLI